jgi:hypothetical protein
MEERIARWSATPADTGEAVAPDPEADEQAAEFVRFCYRRRRVSWPELYDEMCAVAGRGAYRGWGFAELHEHGIGFTLRDMPRLAGIAARVCREERAATSHPKVRVVEFPLGATGS